MKKFIGIKNKYPKYCVRLLFLLVQFHQVYSNYEVVKELLGIPVMHQLKFLRLQHFHEEYQHQSIPSKYQKNINKIKILYCCNIKKLKPVVNEQLALKYQCYRVIIILIMTVQFSFAQE